MTEYLAHPGRRDDDHNSGTGHPGGDSPENHRPDDLSPSKLDDEHGDGDGAPELHSDETTHVGTGDLHP